MKDFQKRVNIKYLDKESIFCDIIQLHFLYERENLEISQKGFEAAAEGERAGTRTSALPDSAIPIQYTVPLGLLVLLHVLLGGHTFKALDTSTLTISVLFL